MPLRENSNVPVGNVINQVLLEHEAPAFDDVEQGQLERLGVHTEPHLKQLCVLNVNRVFVYLLIGVDLWETGRLVDSLNSFTSPVHHEQ